MNGFESQVENFIQAAREKVYITGFSPMDENDARSMSLAEAAEEFRHKQRSPERCLLLNGAGDDVRISAKVFNLTMENSALRRGGFVNAVSDEGRRLHD